jgi:hypothetical protein
MSGVVVVVGVVDVERSDDVLEPESVADIADGGVGKTNTVRVRVLVTSPRE